jgi:hypothetical protein
MKSYREILESDKSKRPVSASINPLMKTGVGRKKGKGGIDKLNFIADQLVNDEYSTDRELADHLAKQTGMDLSVTKKIVKQIRPKTIKNPLMMTDDIIKMIQRVI